MVGLQGNWQLRELQLVPELGLNRENALNNRKGTDNQERRARGAMTRNNPKIEEKAEMIKNGQEKAFGH
jgi:hypothetical protein